MNVGITITGDDFLARKAASVRNPAKLQQLHEFMGNAVKEVTRDYLAALAHTRHATATRLGAQPTGHLEQAARAVESAPLSADSTAASFTINHPGIARAFREIHIAPKSGKFLTIPLNAIAYGRRCGEFDKVIFNPDRSKPVPTNIAAYLLVRSVTQKQDRSLLPSDAEWEAAARKGAELFFESEGI